MSALDNFKKEPAPKKEVKVEVLPEQKVNLQPEPVVTKPVITETTTLETENTAITPTTINTDSSPQVLVSHTDAYIWDRMKSQPRNLDDIRVEVERPDAQFKHRLTLPDEIKAHQKRFTFKWIYKNKKAIDEACDIKGWTLVNRTYFPELPKHFFTANGSMERGDAILGFMPNEKAKVLRERPGIQSTEMLRGAFTKHEGDPKFYKPKGEEDNELVQMI